MGQTPETRHETPNALARGARELQETLHSAINSQTEAMAETANNHIEHLQKVAQAAGALEKQALEAGIALEAANRLNMDVRDQAKKLQHEALAGLTELTGIDHMPRSEEPEPNIRADAIAAEALAAE